MVCAIINCQYMSSKIKENFLNTLFLLYSLNTVTLLFSLLGLTSVRRNCGNKVASITKKNRKMSLLGQAHSKHKKSLFQSPQINTNKFPINFSSPQHKP